MIAYSELTHVNRGAPCAEYPGQWIVYAKGEVVGTFDSKDGAMLCAQTIVDTTSEKVSVCWACSDDDPRVGQVWFTGYYQLGYFDSFGRWVS